jgi:hypothetical protein
MPLSRNERSRLDANIRLACRSAIDRRTRSSGAVSAAGVQTIKSSPDDHFAATPHCCVTGSGSGCVGDARSCPTVGDGIVPPAGVNSADDTNPAPNDHFATGPYCGVSSASVGRRVNAGGHPAVRAGIVSPAGVQIVGIKIHSAPDDHFTATPHCRVVISTFGRVRSAGGHPTVAAPEKSHFRPEAPVGPISPAGRTDGATGATIDNRITSQSKNLAYCPRTEDHASKGILPRSNPMRSPCPYQGKDEKPCGELVVSIVQLIIRPPRSYFCEMAPLYAAVKLALALSTLN